MKSFFLKSLALFLLLGTVFNVQALWPAPYLSLNGGYGYIDVTAPNPSGVSRTQDGVTWGGEAGLLFTENLGIEIGYDQLSNVTRDGVDFMHNNQVLHASVVGVLRSNEGYDLIAKMGVAQESFFYHDNQYIRHYVPMFSLGAGYEITPQVRVDLMANATVAQGNNNGQLLPNVAPAFYWGTLGVTYIF